MRIICFLRETIRAVWEKIGDDSALLRADNISCEQCRTTLKRHCLAFFFCLLRNSADQCWKVWFMKSLKHRWSIWPQLWTIFSTQSNNRAYYHTDNLLLMHASTPALAEVKLGTWSCWKFAAIRKPGTQECSLVRIFCTT